MEEELLNLLKTNKIFSSLDDEAHKKLLPKFEKVELNHGEVLFQQGDPSEYIYLLTQGRLSAIVTEISGETRIVGHIDAGESVGESGALTREPRSLTLKALKNCTLYKLPCKDFMELCNSYPAVMFETISPIIMRSRNLIKTLAAEKAHKVLVIVPANPDVSLTVFSQHLMDLADNYSSLTLVSDFHPDFNDTQDTATLQNRIHELEKHKKSSHKFVYLLKSNDSTLAKICLKRADNLYIVAYSHAKPTLDPFLTEKINHRRLHHKNDPELILLHTDKILTPHNTAKWLMQAQFAFHYHIRVNIPKDYLRLFRFMRGKAVGIVLGGGGTRGWAHLGVLKALREKKIPIDMIGGTSVGAIIAGCYAMHESYEDAYERFDRLVAHSTHSVSWMSLTWPALSVFNAKRFTLAQIEAFGQTQIEDLWLPYFCVSSNLASNTEGIHTTGTLWEKTRASSAIPGITPPMLINGELHYDGGLLNNLPTDIMRSILGNKAKIVAAEISSFSTDRHHYYFPPYLTFWNTLLAKLGFGTEKYRFPRFVDTFLRGLFIGSLAKAKQNSLATNILISLNLNKYRLLHSSPKHVGKLVEIGYQATIEQVDLYREKLNSDRR